MNVDAEQVDTELSILIIRMAQMELAREEKCEFLPFMAPKQVSLSLILSSRALLLSLMIPALRLNDDGYQLTYPLSSDPREQSRPHLRDGVRAQRAGAKRRVARGRRADRAAQMRLHHLRVRLPAARDGRCVFPNFQYAYTKFHYNLLMHTLS